MPIFKRPQCPIQQPHEVLLLLSNTREAVEQNILGAALNSLQVKYICRYYNCDELAYGPLPNLVLRNRVYRDREIMEALGEMYYTSTDFMWNERHKAFVRDVSERFRHILHYYRSFSKTFGGVGHISEKDMRRDCIELFEMLKRSLIDNTFDFEDKPELKPLLPLPDIIVFYYLEAITKNVPGTESDCLLRSNYAELLEWKTNIKETVERVMWDHLPEGGPGKEIFADLQITLQPEVARPTLNINWQRSLVSLGIIGLLYGLFV